MKILKPKINQRGAISMLTVIFLALLLTIITTSFVRLSVTEQRQAIDDDLTTRAFYAAESGIEDAKRAIAEFQSDNSYDLNGDECGPAQSLDGDLDIANLETEYTCQLIDMSPASYEERLDRWKAVTIPLRGESAFTSVLIEWHTGDDYALRNNQRLLPIDAWTGSGSSSADPYPAMLRTALFSHPDTNNFSAASVEQAAVFLNPAQSGTGGTDIGNPSTATDDGTIVDADCEDSSSAAREYACRATIANIDSNRTNYLRLQALYVAADIKVTLLDSSSNPVLLEDVQALVDVTGRAGDVFRRVEARVSLLVNDYPLPDIALWSNTEVCKDFTVTNDPTEYDNSCDWYLNP